MPVTCGLVKFTKQVKGNVLSADWSGIKHVIKALQSSPHAPALTCLASAFNVTPAHVHTNTCTNVAGLPHAGAAQDLMGLAACRTSCMSILVPSRSSPDLMSAQVGVE